MANQTKGDKFPLLVYQRWGKSLRLPSLLIVIASAVAWWFAPDIPQLADRDWVMIVIGVISALIFIYSLLARRAAYVQCLPNYVKIRTPLFAVHVSYRRITQVRPVKFHTELDPADVKRTRLRMLAPFLERTVLLLEMRRFPISERSLRRWLPWYMFANDVTGFVLVVKDWMALSRQITDFSDRWVARRQARERPKTGLLH